MLELEDERKIELALLQPRQALVRLPVDVPNVDVGIGDSEAPYRRGGKRRGRGRERPEPQWASSSPRDRLELVTRIGAPRDRSPPRA